MAEPVIISFARGLLRQFPGVPEGVVDVIPVDLVVAAIIAVAAHGPDPDGPAVFQVASGVRNPLRYGQLVDLVRGRGSPSDPLYDNRGQPIVVPKWSFPGRGKVQGELRRATESSASAERAVNMLPAPGRAGRFRRPHRGAARPSRAGARLRRALRRLHRDRGALQHRPHARASTRRSTRRTGRHSASTPPSSIGVITSARSTCPRWSSTLGCAPRRASGRSAPARTRAEACDPLRRAPDRRVRPREHAHRLERRRELCLARDAAPRPRRAGTYRRRPLAEAPTTARRRPSGPERLPSQLLPALRGSACRAASGSMPSSCGATCSRPGIPRGPRRVREHRALGHATVLITGALDFVIEPLRPLFDEIVCASLGEEDGKLTGEMVELASDR